MPGLSEIGIATDSSARRDAPAQQTDSALPPTQPVPQFSSLNIEAGAVVAVGIAFLLGILLELSPLNGSVRLTGWMWPWRSDLDILRSVMFLLVPFACIASVLRQDAPQTKTRVSINLAVLTAGNFLLQLMGAAAEPRGIEQLRAVVLSPLANSYYLDAARISGLAPWLAQFDRASLGFHSSTHPPGPVVFYFLFFKLFGFSVGALAGGVAVGAVASLGVPVMYFFSGLWTDNPRARLTAAAFYALVPALTVFFPEMDQFYPIFSMLLMFFWVKSLASEQKHLRDPIRFGALLFIALFFAYNLLTIGTFLAYYGIHWWWHQDWSKAAARKLLQSSAIAGGVCAGSLIALWSATGYHPIRSFFHALACQAAYADLWHRTYLISALLDPYDFFLGAGILAVPLVMFYLYRSMRAPDALRPEFALTLIGLAAILTIDLSGLLRGEASRVWLFLQPLLVVPAALELSRYRDRWRLAIFSMQWLIVAGLKAKMLFIRP